MLAGLKRSAAGLGAALRVPRQAPCQEETRLSACAHGWELHPPTSISSKAPLQHMLCPEEWERGQHQLSQILTVTALLCPLGICGSVRQRGLLQACTSLLVHQALQFLEFRDHVRSQEVGGLQEGILLSGNTQDSSHEPGTQRDTVSGEWTWPKAIPLHPDPRTNSQLSLCQHHPDQRLSTTSITSGTCSRRGRTR